MKRTLLATWKWSWWVGLAVAIWWGPPWAVKAVLTVMLVELVVADIWMRSATSVISQQMDILHTHTQIFSALMGEKETE